MAGRAGCPAGRRRRQRGVFLRGLGRPRGLLPRPDGNIVELIARHTLANPSDAPFGPDQILGISEIGVVVADVPAQAAALQARTGAGVYGAGGPTFTALGDHHGLLILVPAGRPWFPTRDQLATPLPLCVAVEPGGEIGFEC